MTIEQEIPSFTLRQYGDPINISVRNSIKAKRISIRVNKKIVELILPRRAILSTAYQFLQKSELWIRKKLQQNSHSSPEITDGTILFFGESYKVICNISRNGSVNINDREIIVGAMEGTHHNILEAFLHEKLLEEVTRQSNIISKKYNLNYAKISVRDNSSRWGSCSNKKNLSFSLRLSLVPIEIIEYVVAHEMSHLKEMNHSKKFWSLVEKIYPDYKNAKLWLKKKSRDLPQVANMKII